ncbi:MAG: hypothetical protein QNJ38_01390 [Prochloraceae cyanobacterium]|nr:hypothetical protein [Prochloraceae cyanobacterium]
MENFKLPFLAEYQPDIKAQKKVNVGRDKTTGVLSIAKHYDLTGLEYDWLDEERQREGIKNNNVLLAEFVDGVSKKYNIELTEVWKSVTRIERAAIAATDSDENDWIEILQNELACPLQDYIEYSEQLKTYARRDKYLKATLVLKFRVNSETTLETVKNPDLVPVGLVDCLAQFCDEEMAKLESSDQNVPEPITDKQIKNSSSSEQSPSEEIKPTGRKSTGKSKDTGEIETNGLTGKTLASSHSG